MNGMNANGRMLSYGAAAALYTDKFGSLEPNATQRQKLGITDEIEAILAKRNIRSEAWIVDAFYHERLKAEDDLSRLMRMGSLKPVTNVVEGFENLSTRDRRSLPGRTIREAPGSVRIAVSINTPPSRGPGLAHKLIIVTVHDQRRHGDLLQVLVEVGLGKGHDPIIVRFRAAHHALAPPILDDTLIHFRACTVVAVERARRQVAIELRSVGGDLSLKSIEHLLGSPSGLRAFLTIRGGTAPSSTAFATRLSP